MWQGEGMSDIQGREFDWFALDSDGNIALFATAGEGFIPAEVVNNIAMHDAISKFLPTPHWGSIQVWDDYAAKGLFVFDWNLPGGPYLKQAVPTAQMAEDLRVKIIAIKSIPFLKGTFESITEFKHWPAT